MASRATRRAGCFFPLLLALHCFGCASGPPGSAYPEAVHVLYTKQPPPAAQVISKEAHDFLEDVGNYLDLRVPPGGLLRIYHYPNRWGLWWHLNRNVPSLRWRAGVCYETDDAYVVTLCGNPHREGFRLTLRHELTHYLVAVYFCDIPPWIDEGLSQVLACGPPFPHLGEDVLESARREARRSKERGCLRLLHIPSGEKLSKSQYHVACLLTFFLLTRSAEAAPNRLVRFLEAIQPDAPPEQTFFDCWGISMEEACSAVASSADSESGIRGQGPRVRFNR